MPQKSKEERQAYNKTYYQANKCEHNKQKSRCRDCGGKGICEHKRRKRECKECLSVPQYLVLLQNNQMAKLKCRKNVIIEYLGCDVNYFKEYIQKKMTSEMDWNNIQFDHIKPISIFDLNNPDEFLSCCHYSNFQPLLSTTNKQKRNKWTEENEIFWKENINYKEYYDLYIPE